MNITLTPLCVRWTRRLLSACALLALALLMAQAKPAHAQGVCGAEVKNEVAKLLSTAKTDKELQEAEAYVKQKYSYCAQDGNYVKPDDPFHTAARQCSAKAGHVGNLFFEEMPCCGYDPQRKTFGCPIKIKQPFGFGGAPFPGSREYTLHCVADKAGVFHPVALGHVHLANEMHGVPAPWQFATIAQVEQNLGLVWPLSGETRQARSILSWALRPTGCYDKPYWGNVIDYPIRLDQ
jgi:hypothetical protein